LANIKLGHGDLKSPKINFTIHLTSGLFAPTQIWGPVNMGKTCNNITDLFAAVGLKMLRPLLIYVGCAGERGTMLNSHGKTKLKEASCFPSFTCSKSFGGTQESKCL
jgi:hypothetical protein